MTDCFLLILFQNGNDTGSDQAESRLDSSTHIEVKLKVGLIVQHPHQDEAESWFSSSAPTSEADKSWPDSSTHTHTHQDQLKA